MIKWKDGEFSLPDLKSHTVELFPFNYATKKSLVESKASCVALGQNCIKISVK